MNDLPGGISSQLRLFADDTALYLRSSALQKDLDTLSVWESKWDMQFNPSKCQVVQVTGSKSKKPINSEYGQVLETVTCARYLGVDVSSTLSWNSHIDRVVNNANRTFGYIRRNIKCQNTDVRESAYNTLVRPQLDMPLQYGTHILKSVSLKLKWSSEGLLAGLLEILTVKHL